MISTKSASTLPIITEESADQAIQDIRVIGFVDTEALNKKLLLFITIQISKTQT